jgi:hypothetical protein
MKFEDAGRAIDREVTKLREFLDRKFKSATREDMAEILRKASERLAKLAERLEKAKGR